MEQKIKAFLSSPTEENQRLGCQMAKSILNWSNFDIMMYVLNIPRKWKVIPRNNNYAPYECSIIFLGKYISFIKTVSHYKPIAKFNLNIKGVAFLSRKKNNYCFSKPNKELKKSFNKFIEQNL